MENIPFSAQAISIKAKSLAQDVWYLIPTKNASIKNSTTHIDWTPPPIGFFKLNTNGSAKGNPGLVAAGGLIRDHNGSWIASFTKSIGFTHPIAAELQGLMEGLVLVKNLNIRNLLIEINAKVVTDIISSQNDTSFVTHPYSNLILECRSLLRCFEDARISHTHREGNYCADILAKEGIFSSSSFVYHSSPPYCIMYQLLADA